MRYTLTVLATCLIAVVLLTGCQHEGSGTGSTFDFEGGTSVGSAVESGGVGGGGGAPEPTTIALLGLGTLVLSRRRH